MNSSVNQNEYAIWRDKDPHSDAWQSLRSSKAMKIARQIGIPDPTDAQQCLGCHSTNVESGAGATGVDAENGVTCEACHGAASNWLGVHSSGVYFYEKNLKYGMYPTADPRKRAELCVSCHIGTIERFVTHEMMALGHPKPTFQLNYHTWFKPDEYGVRKSYEHFDADDDYLQRKPRPFGLKALLIGEIVQWRQYLTMLNGGMFLSDAVFPELAFFNCSSCHFLTDSKGGAVNDRSGIRNTASLPRLADHNFFLVDLAAEGIADMGLRDQIRRARTEMTLGTSYAPGRVKKYSGDIIAQLNLLLDELEAYEFTLQDELGMLGRVASETGRGALADDPSAKQALYATAALIDGLWRREQISRDQYVAAQKAINSGLLAEPFRSKQSDRPQAAILEAVAALGKEYSVEQQWGAE